MKRQVIEFNEDLEREINAWRGKHNTIPPFKEAVAALCGIGLREEAELQKTLDELKRQSK